VLVTEVEGIESLAVWDSVLTGVVDCEATVLEALWAALPGFVTAAELAELDNMLVVVTESVGIGQGPEKRFPLRPSDSV
jgi:hypothetical protein